MRRCEERKPPRGQPELFCERTQASGFLFRGSLSRPASLWCPETCKYGRKLSAATAIPREAGNGPGEPESGAILSNCWKVCLAFPVIYGKGRRCRFTCC